VRFFVYLLKSCKDGRFYIGQTNNVEVRLALHNAGKVKSTRGRRPLELMGVEEYATREEARFREHALKTHSDKKRRFIGKHMKAVM